jgi:hypothetical protein
MNNKVECEICCGRNGRHDRGIHEATKSVHALVTSLRRLAYQLSPIAKAKPKSLAGGKVLTRILIPALRGPAGKRGDRRVAYCPLKPNYRTDNVTPDWL